ncbi:septation protein SepH [Aeromicrobium terrae]|nr:septation protein SepH [Aeromicrobium terrae]
MRELGLDGLSEDGRFLIARHAPTNETFHIRADRRLSSLIDASTRIRSGSPSGQLEITMESTLSPRDIQTRIRRGESPDEVAEAAGVPVEQISAFAAPVLAEREFMCEQARKTTVRRKHVGGTGMPLGTLVDEKVAAEGGVPDEIVWDSWRREDGRWTVVATIADADQPATFLFDVKGRYVLPADEVAHDLVGDVALPEDSSDMAIADVLREEAVAAEAPAVETEPDEIVPDVESEEFHAAVSSLKEARDRKAMEQMAIADEEADAAEAERQEQQLTDDVGQVEITLEQDIAVPDTMPRKKKHERRRVPSWDEIMFGGKDD